MTSTKIHIIIEEKISPILSDKDEIYEISSNGEGCQSNSGGVDLNKSNVSEYDSNALEKVDKKRVNGIRSKFY
jgi:hypothetical protein